MLIDILLILVQAADLVLHAATEQLELLRVSASAIILGWICVDRLWGRASQLTGKGGLALTAYLSLNAVFLIQSGWTNPRNGELRAPLLVLVAATAILWIARQRRTHTAD